MKSPARLDTDDANAKSGNVTATRHPFDLLVMLLLVVGFFVGPLKLLGTSWLSYVTVDGLAILIVALTFAQRVGSRRPVITASPLTIPILLIVGMCFLELANPDAPFIRSILGLRSWVLYLAFLFVGLYTLRAVEQVERLYTVLLVLGVVTASYGIYQWQVGPESFASWSDYYGAYARTMWSAAGGHEVFRAFSTFVLPNAFGSNMGLLMILALAVAASPRIRTLWRGAAAGAFALMGAGIAASGTRAPVVHLMLAAGMGLLFVSGGRRRVRIAGLAGAMVVVALLMVVFLVGPVVSDRFYTIFDPDTFFWKWFGALRFGIAIAQQHPFGAGLGYTAGVPQFVANAAFRGLDTTPVDSGYGAAAAELGIVGLGLFAYFAFKVGVEGYRAWNALPAGLLRDLMLGPALLAATYPLVSVIYVPQAMLPSSIYFWLLVGMLMKAPNLQKGLDANSVSPPEVYPREQSRPLRH
jgi:hypothetical protein